jgi:hypothetical protein
VRSVLTPSPVNHQAAHISRLRVSIPQSLYNRPLYRVRSRGVKVSSFSGEPYRRDQRRTPQAHTPARRPGRFSAIYRRSTANRANGGRSRSALSGSFASHSPGMPPQVAFARCDQKHRSKVFTLAVGLFVAQVSPGQPAFAPLTQFFDGASACTVAIALSWWRTRSPVTLRIHSTITSS